MLRRSQSRFERLKRLGKIGMANRDAVDPKTGKGLQTKYSVDGVGMNRVTRQIEPIQRQVIRGENYIFEYSTPSLDVSLLVKIDRPRSVGDFDNKFWRTNHIVPCRFCRGLRSASIVWPNSQQTVGLDLIAWPQQHRGVRGGLHARSASLVESKQAVKQIIWPTMLQLHWRCHKNHPVN